MVITKEHNRTLVGCHVSIASGVENAPERARDLGCDAMQMFSRSPHGGPVLNITEEVAKSFKKNCKKFKIQNTYVHAPYFINFASGNNRIYYGSISAIRTELKRASALGAKYVMTHIGSAKDMGEKESFKKVVDGFKKILDRYKGDAGLLIENSAGAGKIIGDKFGEIGKILKALKKYKKLAGICLDTQHSFASGYDWKNDFDGVVRSLKKDIGLDNVKLIHANDSMTEMGSHKDRHEHIGKGKIGMDAFVKIVQFAKKNSIDMICETKYPGVMGDIKILQGMVAGG